MPPAPSGSAGRPPRFNFILQPEFPLNALILASDALRIANQNSGRQLFDWTFVSEDGTEMRASNGMGFAVDCALSEMPPAEVYLLFEGNLPTQHISSKLLGHLRAAARFGAVIGGVDTGAFALAQAGVVGAEKHSDIVLHWEAVSSFVERFPGIRPRNQIYLTDGSLANCAGGVATLDMMLELISRFQGEAMANEVANALVHSRRPASCEQRNDGLLEAEHNALPEKMVALMERHLDFPLTLEELALELGVSKRTLARCSQSAFGESPMRLYLHVRLQASRNFLFYEEHTIKYVANACGFSYPAVFARAFKAQFGTTPSQFRADLRASQNQTMRPEIRRLIRLDRRPMAPPAPTVEARHLEKI